ncbi:MAG: hypothetical protein ACXV5U_14740 [Ilumatobacteraceae bacterium]
MDISDTLAPKSDQLDAVDLLGGPQTFTIEKVTKNDGDQPLNITLKEFPRVWRPGKSMRRVLAFIYTKDASKWVGQRITLFCDPAVVFGGVAVGGTRISHMSGIDGPKKVPLIVGKGKSGTYLVQPLIEDAPTPTATPAPTLDEETLRALDELKAEWKDADPERRKVIELEADALRNGADQ